MMVYTSMKCWSYFVVNIIDVKPVVMQLGILIVALTVDVKTLIIVNVTAIKN